MLHCRSQQLVQNPRGFNVWRQTITPVEVPTNQAAIIICDMWDQHWSRGATERVGMMVGRMNRVITAARNKGVHIIHAPSDVMDYYADSPARQRILNVPAVPLPPLQAHADPPLPIDDSDEGSDTNEAEPRQVWHRQHEALGIDPDQDVISDNGQEIYSYIQQQNITQLIMMGVHTNMCILHRSFAIKQMVRLGMDIVLVRDLTDTMYNPAMPPYVSHEDGTRLVVEFIEKHWCPSILSEDLL
ncbi:MAG: isochorismatase family protein [Anaerolineae bacterium]|nr:isochorismatase family protein [Anaerolineae bacterium]